MDTAKALDLIKKGIEGQLDDIQHGRDPWKDHTDLANECLLTDEDYWEWIVHNKDIMLSLIVGQSDQREDEFISLIQDVMESEWYEELYQRHITQAREGIMDQKDWEYTKQSLMPGRV